ncbi:hypothetical protein LB465_07075 [Salegentibacter sp. LM13S]|uniref:hypothetical protein n=1 Tax=Salegentibacter lacus TaxID=2873599 RepID=UPI001CCC6C42|nr:hypothetical protein [Salegentibacter lacus]MBZ9630538.1 hypothetical protein [Salegentibacter lacus]
MRNTVLLVIVICFFSSCSNSDSDSPEFLNYNWKDKERVWIKNGMYNSYSHFEPDTGKMVGDSLIPIEVLNDSLLVITSIGPKGTFDEDFKFIPNRDTVYFDTLTYELREFKGTKLLLYPVNGRFYSAIYELEGNAEVPTHITKDIIKFEVAGFSIGDTIDRDLIEVKDTRNYDGRAFEIVTLKTNRDVQVDLIGGKYIYKITQHGISEYDLDEVIEVVSHKMGFEPEHKPTSQAGDYEQEYYDWVKDGVRITLQKVLYVGDDSMKKLVKDNDWTLYYEDRTTSSLLWIEFADGPPKSSIIN